MGMLRLCSLLALATAVVGFRTPQRHDSGAEGASKVAGSSRMSRSDRLYEGEQLRSDNGQFKMEMQSDGNLVVYSAANEVMWETGTHNKGPKPHSARFQSSGDFVVRAGSPSTVLFRTGTSGDSLQLEGDGRVVIRDSNGGELWSSSGSPSSAAPRRRSRRRNRRRGDSSRRRSRSRGPPRRRGGGSDRRRRVVEGFRRRSTSAYRSDFRNSDGWHVGHDCGHCTNNGGDSCVEYTPDAFKWGSPAVMTTKRKSSSSLVETRDLLTKRTSSNKGKGKGKGTEEVDDDDDDDDEPAQGKGKGKGKDKGKGKGKAEEDEPAKGKGNGKGKGKGKSDWDDPVAKGKGKGKGQGKRTSSSSLVENNASSQEDGCGKAKQISGHLEWGEPIFYGTVTLKAKFFAEGGDTEGVCYFDMMGSEGHKDSPSCWMNMHSCKDSDSTCRSSVNTACYNCRRCGPNNRQDRVKFDGDLRQVTTLQLQFHKDDIRWIINGKEVRRLSGQDNIPHEPMDYRLHCRSQDYGELDRTQTVEMHEWSWVPQSSYDSLVANDSLATEAE